jgi:hypothetical protein
VPGCVKMIRGVVSRRAIAATDVTTFETHAKMHPTSAGLEAFLASSRCFGFHVFDLIEMGTGGHTKIYREYAAIVRDWNPQERPSGLSAWRLRFGRLFEPTRFEAEA